MLVKFGLSSRASALAIGLAGSIVCSIAPAKAQSVAQQWNQELLAAIRIDFPAPTVHARNLLHLSIAMYDAWAAYDPAAIGFLRDENATATNIEAARNEAISHAAYRLLSARAERANNPSPIWLALDERMIQLGYNRNNSTLAGDSPPAVGNRCAEAVLIFGSNDGALESSDYKGPYSPVNAPLILLNEGAGDLNDPNRWQPLAFDVALTQNGLEADKVQSYVGPHWGFVTPFALSGRRYSVRYPFYSVYADLDPGHPPYLGGAGDAEFKANLLTVIRRSAALDPSNGEMIDISPGARGANPVGANDGTGHPVNPVTREPYPPNVVKHGDYGRVVAEYWADGPQSETPPGHWNVLANDLAMDPRLEKRLGGTGPVMDDLEWDVKLYLALNGAVHDAAIAAWGVKAYYDYVRPITGIRYLGGLGQSSDPDGPSYHPNGLPLEPGLVEVVTAESSASAQRHQHLSGSIGKIAIRAWGGEPADPETEFTGARWILAEAWFPYQRSTFVTPAFAGYVSGHSTFSRAAAEVLAAFTGSPYFPGGIRTLTVAAGDLDFELGPTEDIQLQWATYYDAADEAGISRIYGGIHVPADDGPGRKIGSKIGKLAFERARTFFDGSALTHFPCRVAAFDDGHVEITWPCVAGQLYKVQVSTDLRTFENLSGFAAQQRLFGSFAAETPVTGNRFYRIVRQE